jgi:hypothetical protein
MRGAAACVLALTAIAAASDAGAQGLSYGVKGGIALADLDATGEDSAVPTDFRVGLVAGGFITWPLAGRLEFQPEVLYTQKGSKADVLGGTSTQKLDYLDIPLLLSYRLKGSRERNLAVFGGPSLGVRLRARSNAAFGGGSFEDDVSDQVKSTDFAAVAGVAYHRGRLVVDGRYSWGFTDIDRDTGDGVEIRNRGISILAGWRF